MAAVTSSYGFLFDNHGLSVTNLSVTMTVYRHLPVE